MRSLFACCLLVCAILASSLACAGDAVLEKAYFEDVSAQMRLEDVQSQPLTPLNGVLSKGYVKSAFWVRLVIEGQSHAASAADATRYVVRVQPSFLDELALYDPSVRGNLPQWAGDLHPIETHGYQSLNHNFLISLTPQARTIWIRLKTSSTSNLAVEVLPQDEAMNRDRQQDTVMGFFVSALFIFLVWALVYGYSGQDPLAKVLIISQGVTLAHALTLWGYARLWFADHVSPATLDTATSLLVMLSASSFLWFHIRFISEFSPPRSMMRFLNVLLTLLPIELALFVFGEVRLSLQLNMLMGLLAPPALVITALGCRVWQERPQDEPPPVISKLMLVSFYGVMHVMALVLTLQALGLTDNNKTPIATGPLFGLFSGLVLITTLQLRSRRIQQANAIMEMKLQLAQQDAAQEKRQREEQSRFMGMLTHELKTPLGVLLIVINATAPSQAMRARAKRAITDMNGVIERCALVDKLEEGNLSQDQERFDFYAEAQQVMHSLESEALVLAACREPISVFADRQLVHVVLKNLMENALKYAAPQSTVQMQVDTLRSEQGTAMARFSIANTPGDSGWPDSDKLFSKYYRSAGAHRTTGSGLGLHLSKHVAVYLGGDLRYTPNTQQVRFEFCLPV
jgi:signal transduction histidine kinase